MVRLATHAVSRFALHYFVRKWHRHLPRARPGDMSRFGVSPVGACLAGCVGVASVGRPAARKMPTGVLEVDRVATNGTANACSALYGAAARWARKHSDAMWLVTYTLYDEPGVSLKAAGWYRDPWYRGRRQPKWTVAGASRADRQGPVAERKQRWWLPLRRDVHPIQWLPKMGEPR